MNTFRVFLLLSSICYISALFETGICYFFYFWHPLILPEITLRVLFLYKPSWLIARWTVILRTADHIQYYKQMCETVLGMCDKKDWFYHFNLPVRRRKQPGCVTGFELMDWCERGTRFSLNQQKKTTLIVSYVTKIHSLAPSHFCHALTEVWPSHVVFWKLLSDY